MLRNVLEFLPELGRNGSLALLVLLTAGAEILGFSVLSLLPSIARDVLGLGADGFGLIQSVGAVGGGATVVLLALVGRRQAPGDAVPARPCWCSAPVWLC